MLSSNTVNIYTDGSCIGNPGPGGWAVIIIDGSNRQVLSGHETHTTNNRMEIMAILKGLEALSIGSTIVVHSDSRYVINTMSRGWRRNTNSDLWQSLDAIVCSHSVSWKWVKGHSGHPENEEADAIAHLEASGQGNPAAASQVPKKSTVATYSGHLLSHLDDHGQANMVDVGGKDATHRKSVARCFVTMRRETLTTIREGNVGKGDVFSVARLAGIMGAKQTPNFIPLCHPIPLDQVTVQLQADEVRIGVHITASASAYARTGVEMEALTAVMVAALTLYDMCKSLDHAIRIEEVRLVSKHGGKSGDIVLE
jgi:cyclic pyranopterin phosphate synthase